MKLINVISILLLSSVAFANDHETAPTTEAGQKIEKAVVKTQTTTTKAKKAVTDETAKATNEAKATAEATKQEAKATSEATKKESKDMKKSMGM
jgi:membrane protein involved in colicin uptake